MLLLLLPVAEKNLRKHSDWLIGSPLGQSAVATEMKPWQSMATPTRRRGWGETVCVSGGGVVWKVGGMT